MRWRHLAYSQLAEGQIWVWLHLRVAAIGYLVRVASMQHALFNHSMACSSRFVVVDSMVVILACRHEHLPISVVGVPKSIENDLLLIDSCFGHATAVQVCWWL